MIIVAQIIVVTFLIVFLFKRGYMRVCSCYLQMLTFLICLLDSQRVLWSRCFTVTWLHDIPSHAVSRLLYRCSSQTRLILYKQHGPSFLYTPRLHYYGIRVI